MMTCIGWHDWSLKISPFGSKSTFFFLLTNHTHTHTHLTKTHTHTLLPCFVFISTVLLLSRYWIGLLSSSVVDTLFANSSSTSLSVKKTMRHEWERGRSQFSGLQRFVHGFSVGGVRQLTGAWGSALGRQVRRKSVQSWSMWLLRRD